MGLLYVTGSNYLSWACRSGKGGIKVTLYHCDKTSDEYDDLS